MTLLLAIACGQPPWFEGTWELTAMDSYGGPTDDVPTLELRLDEGDMDWGGKRGSYEVLTLTADSASLQITAADSPPMVVSLESDATDGLVVRQNKALSHRFRRAD